MVVARSKRKKSTPAKYLPLPVLVPEGTKKGPHEWTEHVLNRAFHAHALSSKGVVVGSDIAAVYVPSIKPLRVA